MESIGDFILVILHSLAHIKTGYLADDADPAFLRNFYRVRTVVFQHSFHVMSLHSVVLILGSIHTKRLCLCLRLSPLMCAPLAMNSSIEINGTHFVADAQCEPALM